MELRQALPFPDIALPARLELRSASIQSLESKVVTQQPLSASLQQIAHGTSLTSLFNAHVTATLVDLSAVRFLRRL
jgi:hypothetical protein